MGNGVDWRDGIKCAEPYGSFSIAPTSLQQHNNARFGVFRASLRAKCGNPGYKVGFTCFFISW
jgi:hypothetical protein